MLVCLLRLHMLLQLKRQRHDMDIRPIAASCGAYGRVQRFQDFRVSSPPCQLQQCICHCHCSQKGLPLVILDCSIGLLVGVDCILQLHTA